MGCVLSSHQHVSPDGGAGHRLSLEGHVCAKKAASTLTAEPHDQTPPGRQTGAVVTRRGLEDAPSPHAQGNGEQNGSSDGEFQEEGICRNE